MALDSSAQMDPKERAKLAIERRNYPYAIEIYQGILVGNPNDVDARRALRAVEVRQARETGTSRAAAILKNLVTYVKLMLPSKDHEQVMKLCESYLVNDPTSPKVLKKLAGAAFAAGHKETAEATLEDLHQQYPEDVEGLRMLAAAYREMGRTKKALEICHIILRYVPGDREATQGIRDLSATDMSAKFVEAATSEERGRGAQKILKDEKEAERYRREALRTEEEVRAEIADTKDDLKERPDDHRLYIKLGNLNLRLRDYDEAESMFQKAREMSPTEYTIDMKLQDVDIARLRDAAAVVGKQYKASPKDPKVKAAYRAGYMKHLEYRLRCFEEREQRFPTDLSVAFVLGNLYFEKQMLDEAIKRYQRTVHDPKNRSRSLLNLGISFQKKGQHDLALKQLTEGINYNEVWNEMKQTLIYQRGDCHERMGKKEEAIADFTSIYEKDIAFKDVAKRIEKLQKG